MDYRKGMQTLVNLAIVGMVAIAAGVLWGLYKLVDALLSGML